MQLLALHSFSPIYSKQYAHRLLDQRLLQTLADQHNLLPLSIGDLVRRELTQRTVKGEAMREVMDAGQLIPDDWVVELVVKAATHRLRPGQRLVLINFPKTPEQARLLEVAFGQQITSYYLFVSDERITTTVIDEWTNNKNSSLRKFCSSRQQLDNLLGRQLERKRIAEAYLEQFSRLRTIDVGDFEEAELLAEIENILELTAGE